MDVDPICARNTASRREALAKHFRKDDMLQEQGSRHLHQHEISLHSCRLFDIDSQGNVMFLVDMSGNRIELEEIDIRDTALAKDDEWCRLGERYYRKTLDASYREQHRRWWRSADEQGLRWFERVGGIALIVFVATLWLV